LTNSADAVPSLTLQGYSRGDAGFRDVFLTGFVDTGGLMKRIMIGLALACVLCGLASAAAMSPVPDQVYSLYLAHDYAAAKKVISDALSAAKDADTRLALGVELGDLYLDKLRDYPRAESVYKALIEQYPDAKNIADVVYRLAVTDEREEKFLDAAQEYEKVAIKYQGSTYADDALNAIERCFRKNYQDRAAYVDSYPITRLEFDDEVSKSPAQYDKFDAKLKLLNGMIDDRLLYAAALKANLAESPDFISQMSDFRRDQMLQTWYDQEVVKKVVIDDTMKKNYYQAHVNDYITPEQVHAREVQVKTRELADTIYGLVTAQKLPFDSLAKARSVAPDKDRGGDMGFFRKNVRAKEIDDAAFSMKQGDVSHPIKTTDGFVILKIEDRRDRKERTYDDVASEIEGRLKPEKTQTRLNDLLETLKKGHVVQDTGAIAKNKETLAVVDGEPLLMADVNKMMERVPPMYRAQFDNPEGKKRILDQLITEKLVLRVAEQNKYWLSSDVVAATIDREHTLLSSLIKKRESTDKVKIEDKAIQADYQKTLKDFKVPEQVQAKEIVFRSRATADSVHRLLTDAKHPVSFDSMAKTVSIATSKWNAGDMGTITRGQKPKPVENELFSLKPKTISPVVKISDTSFTILMVLEHKAATVRPLTEVKPKIEHKLSQEAEKKLLDEYMAKLRKGANIVIELKDEPQESMPNETIPSQMGDTGTVTTAPVNQDLLHPMAVSAQGVLGSVYFRFDKAGLDDAARKTLDSLVSMLKAQPGQKILLSGNSDKAGSAEVNEEVGLRRAQAVKTYLVKAGIDAGRMELKSLGKTQAKADKRSDYWKDRRVDVIAE
jgi:peptidyl-prolyl cis-trans isomerase C